MPGLSDYSAQNLLNHVTGRVPFPAVASVFLALFTTAPTSNAGTGGTEVSTSATAYARVQVAGQLTANASWTTATATLSFASVPSWVVAGMNVYDTTNGFNIGTVQSTTATTIVLTSNASHASAGAADVVAISAFGAPTASSGTEPSVTPASIVNGAVISFAQATASWGTVTSFGLYDASSAGNYLWGDYLGNFKWLPFSCTSASPGVLTSPAHGFANGDFVVVTAKDGGTLPTTAGSWAGPLTVASATTDTFTAGVNTTSTGDGLVRKITEQSIPNNVTASFSASTFTLVAA